MLDSSGLSKEETLISAPVVPHCVALQVQKRSTRLVFDRKTTRTEFIESDGGGGGGGAGRERGVAYVCGGEGGGGACLRTCVCTRACVWMRGRVGEWSEICNALLN